MDFSNTIKIYALINDIHTQQLLLSNKKNGLSFINGKQKVIDGSSIFSATRIFIKKLFNAKDASDWDSPLFVAWLKKFNKCELIRQGDGNISFFIEICSSDLPSTLKHKLQLLSIDDVKNNYPSLYDEYNFIMNGIQDLYTFYTIKQKKNHFIILNCEPDPNWDPIYDALYQGHWRNKAEIWKTYYMRDEEWPTKEELDQTQGIVISGSEWSVYDPNIPAIPVLLERLRKLVRDFPNIKILGICFGCQALAQAFGGRVGKMKLNKKPMLMNREKLTFLNDFHKKYISNIKDSQLLQSVDSIHIAECHGDNVEVLPNDATLYCTSESTPVEVFGIGDNILAFQGHPEFSGSIVLDFIMPENKSNWENYEDLVSESTKSFHNGPLDFKIMDTLCENFLKAE